MGKPVILTGLRSNDQIHIGNYLGAILPIVKLQKNHSADYQINMFVPDLHSFTTPIDHTMLYQNTLNNLKVFAAAGLDINNSDTFIYRQSFIPAHSELAWILDCFTYFGEASRMIEFKDKSKKFGDSTVSVGQFNYPILMAADILLYDAKWVPLGEDQQQHLELTRDIAIRFNNKFSDIFTVPEEWKKQLEFTNRSSIRIKSLRNPENKMSKSIQDPNGTILMSDEPDEAVKKVMSATTDSVGKINYDPKNQPGISNLIQISALLKNVSLDDEISTWIDKTSYGDLKQSVAELVKQFLADFQSKLSAIDENELKTKLESDEKQVNEIANKKLLDVQKAVGLRQ